MYCSSVTLQLAQTPQIRGTVTYKTACTSDTSHKFKGSPGHVHLYLIGCKHSGSPDSFRFHNLLEQLTELRKVLYYKYSFIVKDTDQEQLMKRHTGRGLGRSRVLSSWKEGTTHFLHIKVFTNQEAPLSFGVQSSII